jgi:hypothetical protein
MATMTPAYPPPNEQGTKAERDAYLSFQAQLPDDFHVYHSLEVVTPEGEQAEIDFLVLHPELGMLVVECKGGGVERDAQGHWIRRHEGHVDVFGQGPWEQASEHKWKLQKELQNRMYDPESGFLGYAREYDKLPLAFGHAVAFPFAEAEEANLPVGADDKILFDNATFDDLEPAVRSAMEFWGRGREKATFDDEEFARFREEVLYPTTTLAESLATRIRSEDRTFERLSNEQRDTLWQIEEYDRMLIEGGAGTGKSLLALEAARRLADEEDRVLLTCFNRKLRDSLARKVDQGADYAGEVEVQHFHGLCGEAIEATDADVEYPDRSDKEKARQFWEEEAPFMLLDALGDGELEGWDAIVVDEAQDFEGDWWDVLQTGLAGGSEGRLVAFQDPMQDLFDRDGEGPEFEATRPLTYNFRNTTEICEVVSELYTGRMQSHRQTPTGEPPEVQTYSSMAEQRQAIEATVEKLLGEEGLTPAHIGIITPRTKPNSVLADCDALAGVPITQELAESDEKLLHASIGSFKGLERDVVLFADVDPDHERCSPKARYVAASRAVNRLYVFQEEDWLGDVRDS